MVMPQPNEELARPALPQGTITSPARQRDGLQSANKSEVGLGLGLGLELGVRLDARCASILWRAWIAAHWQPLEHSVLTQPELIAF